VYKRQPYGTKTEGQGDDPADCENSSHPQQENNGQIAQDCEPEGVYPHINLNPLDVLKAGSARKRLLEAYLGAV